MTDSLYVLSPDFDNEDGAGIRIIGELYGELYEYPPKHITLDLYIRDDTRSRDPVAHGYVSLDGAKALHEALGKLLSHLEEARRLKAVASFEESRKNPETSVLVHSLAPGRSHRFAVIRREGNSVWLAGHLNENREPHEVEFKLSNGRSIHTQEDSWSGEMRSTYRIDWSDLKKIRKDY